MRAAQEFLDRQVHVPRVAGLVDLLAQTPAHWTRYGSDDAVSPPHVTLETRFPCIIGTTENLCSLYAAGGYGMREELRRDLLLVQHAKKSTTPYSRRPNGCYPLRVLLDFKVESTKLWYWDSTIIEHLHDREIASISPDDCRDLLIVRVGEEEPPAWNGDYPIDVRYFESAVLAGKHIVERSLEKFVQLVRGYQSELQAALGAVS